MARRVLVCPRCPDSVELVDDRHGRAVCPSCGASVAAPADERSEGPPIAEDPARLGRSAATPPGGLDSGGLPDPIVGRFSPTFLAQYEVIKMLGQGGMGTVYLARQVELDRLVAVKVVKGDEMSTDQIHRLVKEAKVLASLNHPNIVAVHGAGYDGTLPYVVCEYVEGASLQDRLHTPPPLSLRQALLVTLRTLSGLRVAHDKGVVHRD
ncbi:MAG: protein kinase, partial [Candidatus Riflebacteria bacterium]|nr:protein kinase [Candidatus Riflebacteria bacterium]